MRERDLVRRALYDAIQWQEGLADAQRGMPKEFAEGVALIKAYRTLLKKRYGTDKTMMDVLDDGSVLVSVQDLPKRPK